MPQSQAKKRARKPAALPALSGREIESSPFRWSENPTRSADEGAAPCVRANGSSEIRDRLNEVLARFVPAHIVINSSHEVVQFQGKAGRYLELAPGQANLNLFTMLRQGLLSPLRTTLRAARTHKASVRRRNVKVQTNCGLERINIEITPLHAQEKKDWFVVVFEPADDLLLLRRRMHEIHLPAAKTPVRPGSETVRLREELARVRELLRMTVRQQEMTNGELITANEEVQSANEELQSINEELETSREQLQSSNDELLTINESLLRRTAELAALNGELSRLLASVHIAAVVIDSELLIKSFTAAAEKTFNLIRSDIGRPLKDLNSNVSCPDLETHLRQVIITGEPQSQKARDRSGNVYSLRLNPYLGERSTIEGVTIVVIDLGENGLGQ